MRPLPESLPRWTRIAIWVLTALAFAATAGVLFFSSSITDWMLDRVGFWVLVLGCLLGTAVFVWIGSRLDK